MTTPKTPSNTPSFVYRDNKNPLPSCKNDKDAINKACKPENKGKKDAAQKKGKFSKILDRFSKKNATSKGATTNKDTQWMSDHCDFLDVKPNKPEEIIDKINELPEDLAKELGKNVLEEAVEKAKKEIAEKIAKEAAEIAAKKGATKVATKGATLLTGPFAIAINIVLFAYDIYDANETYNELLKKHEAGFKQIADNVKKLEDINKQIDELKDEIKKGLENPKDLAADIMYGLAEMNDCIRARRCSLVPYKETHGANSKEAYVSDDADDKDNETPSGKSTGKGCCSGQTGHHVIPGAMFKGCPSYNHQKAPTICVEGVNNSHGSHGLAHKAATKRLESPVNGKNFNKGDEMTKEDAIEYGADSLKTLFPYCNQKCLKEQLRAFYDKVDCKPKAHDGMGGRTIDKG